MDYATRIAVYFARDLNGSAGEVDYFDANSEAKKQRSESKFWFYINPANFVKLEKPLSNL